MKHLVVYSADLHGNEIQYEKLIGFAKSESADSLIIGGDLAPKRFSRERFISGQRVFFAEKFPELLAPFKGALPNSGMYLMMGNDDCACVLDVLERYDTKLFCLIQGRRFRLTEDFDIVGYSFVPITPFMLKDWEKFDLSEVPQDMTNRYAERKTWNYRFEGFKSTIEGWKKFHFNKDMEKKESIQRDLDDSLFTENPEKTVFVFHTPPDNTSLDQLYDGSHVGSMAVRLFIENHQPYLTLHGHTHETVDTSGDFKEIIGNATSFSAGNDDLGNDLAVLIFDLHDLKTAKRVLI